MPCSIDPLTYNVNCERYVPYLAMCLAILMPCEHARRQRPNVRQRARLRPKLIERHVMVFRPCEQQHILDNAARQIVRSVSASCLKCFVRRLHTENVHRLLDAPLNDGAVGARNIHQGFRERDHVL